MIEPKLIHIREPKLTFGFDQKMEDPRDGLTLFGSYSKNKHSGQISIGIIGPKEQRDHVKAYIKKIHKPIISKRSDIARPFFPGIESTFDISINFEAIQEIDIQREIIDEYLKYSDGYQRVYNLTNLYSDKLKKYLNEEEIPVTVWFVAIPDEIYQYGRPKSKIPKSDDNKSIGLRKRERDPSALFLFDEMNELKAAYDFEINFHNQLKAKLLNDKIVTQIIRESTIAYEELWTDQEKIEYERLFDTAKAWNISTTLYYKSGGLPWKLGEVRKNVCYLGLVYKQIEQSIDRKNACCAAQMFLDSGDGMVFRGNIGPWFNPKTKEYHITKKDANSLLSMSIESFKDKSETKEYPNEIFIHSKTYFNDEEWEGFKEATVGKSKIIGVRIKDDSAFKLYRDFSYCVPRGTALIVTENSAYLWTKGYIPRIQTQLGLETPNPISVEVVRGEKDIETVCKDILALTKLNYNACIFADGSPVTLRFADSIGEVLTAGRDIKSEVLPFKHYL
ncbi:MAG: hypothetical protein A2W93_09525 [Bacteroidetes bacterium GWF2_43_63]|nr:MAG: hypothetical protein A2W94_05910 [Bacteroidetes bacterium GWE2_42_42]OFY54543.1 MAG: hypothetical protein A2W93_09525 [Bacteroidetes bacterium GWF2_43_63]HBG70486.1 hypothetical protein [Bacteroidales bacterium]HCB63396.1 hypothetical protein [Bacteroidales bacterium]